MTEKTTEAVFGKRNYFWMIAGLAVLGLGFGLMALDREPYGFGLLGLTVGPVAVLAGLGMQFFAILLPAKTKGGQL
jgi:hypothetical protein